MKIRAGQIKSDGAPYETVLMADGVGNATWEEVTVSGGGGIEEAPINNLIYGRKNSSWVEVVSSGGSGHIIQDEGTSKTARTKLNFIGAGVVVEDDAGNDATKVTIATVSGGGGGDVYGPAANTDSYIPQWNGANSKLLKNGLALTTTIADPGVDTNIPTEKSVRDAVNSAASPGEGHIVIFPLDYSSIGAGDWALNINALSWYSAYLKQTTPANGDNISYQVYLAAGTYSLLVIHHKNTVAGIVDIYIDATEVASIDMYLNPLTWNYRNVTTGISVATSGLKTLKFQLHGKHASSSNYSGYIVYAALWRTA